MCPDMPSVTRKSHTARAERRDELRRELLEAVERLIGAGESFTEISVEQLVAEVGISRTTFYVYFADKGEVLAAWFAEIAGELSEVLSAWWELDADSSREDLRGAIEHAMRVYRPHAALMAAAFDTASYDPAVRELTEAFIDGYIASMREHIRKGQQAGFVDPALPADDVAVWLIWMAERGFHVILIDASGAEVARLLDAYAAIAWNTLYAPARR